MRTPRARQLPTPLQPFAGPILGAKTGRMFSKSVESQMTGFRSFQCQPFRHFCCLNRTLAQSLQFATSFVGRGWCTIICEQLNCFGYLLKIFHLQKFSIKIVRLFNVLEQRIGGPRDSGTVFKHRQTAEFNRRRQIGFRYVTAAFPTQIKTSLN